MLVVSLSFLFSFFSQAQAQTATEAADCEPNTEAFVKATLKLPWSGAIWNIFKCFYWHFCSVNRNTRVAKRGASSKAHEVAPETLVKYHTERANLERKKKQ